MPGRQPNPPGMPEMPRSHGPSSQGNGDRPSDTSVAQLVEHRSPKPAVGGSIPSARAASGSVQEGPAQPLARLAIDGPRASSPYAPYRPVIVSRASVQTGDRIEAVRVISPQDKRDGAMGKVKDDVSASKPRSPPRGNQAAASRDTFVPFFANLLQTGLYKPMQGWYARLYTALGWA